MYNIGIKLDKSFYGKDYKVGWDMTANYAVVTNMVDDRQPGLLGKLERLIASGIAYSHLEYAFFDRNFLCEQKTFVKKTEAEQRKWLEQTWTRFTDYEMGHGIPNDHMKDVEERAYTLWINDGKPEGKAGEHYQRAKFEIRGSPPQHSSNSDYGRKHYRTYCNNDDGYWPHEA